MNRGGHASVLLPRLPASRGPPVRRCCASLSPFGVAVLLWGDPSVRYALLDAAGLVYLEFDHPVRLHYVEHLCRSNLQLAEMKPVCVVPQRRCPGAGPRRRVRAVRAGRVARWRPGQPERPHPVLPHRRGRRGRRRLAAPRRRQRELASFGLC